MGCVNNEWLVTAGSSVTPHLSSRIGRSCVGRNVLHVCILGFAMLLPLLAGKHVHWSFLPRCLTIIYSHRGTLAEHLEVSYWPPSLHHPLPPSPPCSGCGTRTGRQRRQSWVPVIGSCVATWGKRSRMQHQRYCRRVTNIRVTMCCWGWPPKHGRGRWGIDTLRLSLHSSQWWGGHTEGLSLDWDCVCVCMRACVCVCMHVRVCVCVCMWCVCVSTYTECLIFLLFFKHTVNTSLLLTFSTSHLSRENITTKTHRYSVNSLRQQQFAEFQCSTMTSCQGHREISIYDVAFIITDNSSVSTVYGTLYIPLLLI